MAPDDGLVLQLPPMRDGRARDVLADATTHRHDLDPTCLAERAARLGAPLVLVAPTVVARRRLARAVHGLGGRPGPLVTLASPAAALAMPSTVLLDLDVLGPALETVAECLADDGDAWLLIGARTLDGVPDGIRRRVAAATVSLPEIEEHAVAEVVRAALEALCGPANETSSIAPGAVAWLQADAEARDAEGLRGLLRRALVLAERGEPIDVHHLPPPAPADVDASATIPKAPPAANPASPDAPHSGPTAARFEYVLAELAHHLRNPLVTLKTVADHLEDLATDPELRTRFAGLANDAVARMEDLLDNLVAYGRLGVPVARAVALTDVLDAAVREAEPALAGRRLSVRASTGAAACLTDPEHLGFALKNLLVGIAQTAEPDGDVLVDARMNGVVRVRFASDADTATLQSLLAPAGTDALYDPAYQPLPFSLARAVLENVGGRVDVAPAIEGGTALEVHLPVPG